eukprot:CAMPEP_0117592016 /NCGR_PEP_ID=MMETSP0784-20121206/71857_1 /TAXON_ID=39447 /ORGANISM="" /LENGTH=86 /DNA_ID=CAMNT_0005393809 /DNA_START=101 /DNA_END=361 /DNA_ORIENTATION=-
MRETFWEPVATASVFQAFSSNPTFCSCRASSSRAYSRSSSSGAPAAAPAGAARAVPAWLRQERGQIRSLTHMDLRAPSWAWARDRR